MLEVGELLVGYCITHTGLKLEQCLLFEFRGLESLRVY